jgi:hypothetical protein
MLCGRAVCYVDLSMHAPIKSLWNWNAGHTGISHKSVYFHRKKRRTSEIMETMLTGYWVPFFFFEQQLGAS